MSKVSRLSVWLVAVALALVGLMLRFHFACKPLLLVEPLAVILVRFVALPINCARWLGAPRGYENPSDYSARKNEFVTEVLRLAHREQKI
jgi:hypothetical protein